MRGPTAILLLSGFLLTLLQGPTVMAEDWLSNLLSGVDQMNRKLQIDLQQMNRQIQQNVNAQVSQINKNVQEQVARANQNVAAALKNAERGAKSNFSSLRFNAANGGSSVVINGDGGTSRTVHSGTDMNGQPYYVESENLVIGDTLFHTDRVYNYTTKNLEERRYTLNLTDPNSKPVYLNVNRVP